MINFIDRQKEVCYVISTCEPAEKPFIMECSIKN